MKTKNLLLAISILLFLCSNNLSAQSTTDEPLPDKTTEKKPAVKSERALQFKNIIVADKTSEFITVKEKQYRWFANKEKAIEYFNNQTLKSDWTVVYIDSSEPNTAEPDIYTISEKDEITKTSSE